MTICGRQTTLIPVLAPQLLTVRRVVIGVWVSGLVFAGAGLLLTNAWVRLLLFMATFAVELLAVILAVAGRARHASDDPGRQVWTWIASGLGLRLIAELRLATLYFDIVPTFVTDDPVVWSVYFFGLRYLYTAADLALLVALAQTRRALLTTDLGFQLRPRDAMVLVLLAPLPVTVYLLQSVFYGTGGSTDIGIHTFRLISATVSAVVSGVSVVLASHALQMGGGAWAWIWGAAAVAGLARAVAFAAAAAIPVFGNAVVVEQALLWTFACGWLLATALHLRLKSPRPGRGSPA